MAIRSRSILKDWFKNFATPPQEQFWDWIDSFFHKNDTIPTSSVDGLDDVIADLPTSGQLDAVDDLTPTVIAVSSSDTFDIPAGKILQHIVCEVSSDSTVKIGTTASGSELREKALIASNPPATFTFNSYLKTQTTIHFTGNFTAIIYLR